MQSQFLIELSSRLKQTEAGPDSGGHPEVGSAASNSIDQAEQRIAGESGADQQSNIWGVQARLGGSYSKRGNYEVPGQGLPVQDTPRPNAEPSNASAKPVDSAKWRNEEVHDRSTDAGAACAEVPFCPQESQWASQALGDTTQNKDYPRKKNHESPGWGPLQVYAL